MIPNFIDAGNPGQHKIIREDSFGLTKLATLWEITSIIKGTTLSLINDIGRKS